MGFFELGAHIIPNSYNNIPGFSVFRAESSVHFLPGFPVMAWPMMDWVLHEYYSSYFYTMQSTEFSMIVYEVMESTITPLLEQIERQYPSVKTSNT
jgi:molybdopterin-biosynthesis enzyme MoeA-like protein